MLEPVIPEHWEPIEKVAYRSGWDAATEVARVEIDALQTEVRNLLQLMIQGATDYGRSIHPAPKWMTERLEVLDAAEH